MSNEIEITLPLFVSEIKLPEQKKRNLDSDYYDEYIEYLEYKEPSEFDRIYSDICFLSINLLVYFTLENNRIFFIKSTGLFNIYYSHDTHIFTLFAFFVCTEKKMFQITWFFISLKSLKIIFLLFDFLRKET